MTRFPLLLLQKLYRICFRNVLLGRRLLLGCAFMMSCGVSQGQYLEIINRLPAVAFNVNLKISDSLRLPVVDAGLLCRSDSLAGAQVALLSAWGNKTFGANVAGLLSVTHDGVYGLQASGITNYIGGRVTGFQMAGLTNFSEEVRGLQLSGLSNAARNSLHGVQVAGISNLLAGDGYGMQWAVAMNISTGFMRGVQLSMRNSADTLMGLQLGLINICNINNGVQVGLVNYSRDTLTRHYGLVNIDPHTRVDLLAFVGNRAKANLAVRLRGRDAYSVIGFGSHYMGLDKQFSGAVFYRLGTYVSLSDNFVLSADAGFFHVETFEHHSDVFPKRLMSIQLRANAEYQLSPHWGTFASLGWADTRYYRYLEDYENGMVSEFGVSYRYHRKSKIHGISGLDAEHYEDGQRSMCLRQDGLSHPWRAGAMVTAVNAFVQRFDCWVLREDYAKIDIHSVRNNFHNAFVWDNDNFNTNLFAHPYHGNLYFNSARSNGLSFWQSFPYALGGSLMWEFFGENTPPAINDLLATSIGGTCIGEITYRISDLLYDDHDFGFSRFLREFAATMVSPMKGVERLLSGKAWQVSHDTCKYHDFSRIPVDFSASANLRYLADNHALFRGEVNPCLELGFDYGNPFDNSVNKPYDFFRVNLMLGFSANQPAVSGLHLLGRLYALTIFENRKVESDFGLFQHFNFYNSEPVLDGTHFVPYRISEAASVGPGFICRYLDLPNAMQLEHSVYVSAILLGGSISDYLQIQERDYNMGSGFSAKIQTRTSFQKIGYFGLSTELYRIYTWKGYDDDYIRSVNQNYTNTQGDEGNVSLLVLNAHTGLYLGNHFTFDLQSKFFFRNTHYLHKPDVTAYTFELQAGVTFHL